MKAIIALLLLALFAGYVSGKGLMAVDMYPDEWQKDCCIVWEVK